MTGKMRRVLFTFILCMVVSGTHAAEPSAIGSWVGTLQAPVGDLRVWLTVSASADSSLSAEFESVDQAPGQKIPVSTITASGETLTFAIKRVGANYEGTWNAKLNQWEGVFSQGMNMPLILKQGTPENNTTTIDGLDGIWRTKMTLNNVDLRLILSVRTSDVGTIATLDSPDQMAYDIPLRGLALDGTEVTFNIPVAGARFVGQLDHNENSITGVWHHAGDITSDLMFKLDTLPKKTSVNRPQEPKAPFPYYVEDVKIDNASSNITLAGTLTLPKGKGPFPAAILISGSGPQDRDETVFGHKPFAVLADHLTRKGIAVLRYDDRGVGESTGLHDKANSQDFATDANAAWHFLASHSAIDPAKIGMIGHSEGGMIAPIAYSENSKIAFLVLLAGPGVNVVDLMLEQKRLIALSQGAKEADVLKMVETLKPILKTIATTGDVSRLSNKLEAVLDENALQSLGVKPEGKTAMIEQLSSPWARFFYAYTPEKYLPSIKVPILAVNGELDVQVAAKQNLSGLKKLLKNNPDATILELPRLNHLFQTAETGALGEYADIEETFAPEALKIISDWIADRYL